MHCNDAIGYLASGLVLAAFGMKDMIKLRIVAICSNVVFIGYALSLGLVPIWALHAVLLPLNVWRLAQVLGIDRAMLVDIVRIGRPERGGQSRSPLTSPQTAR